MWTQTWLQSLRKNHSPTQLSKPANSQTYKVPTLRSLFEPKDVTQKSQKCKYLKIGKIAKNAKIPDTLKFGIFCNFTNFVVLALLGLKKIS